MEDNELDFYIADSLGDSGLTAETPAREAIPSAQSVETSAEAEEEVAEIVKTAAAAQPADAENPVAAKKAENAATVQTAETETATDIPQNKQNEAGLWREPEGNPPSDDTGIKPMKWEDTPLFSFMGRQNIAAAAPPPIKTEALSANCNASCTPTKTDAETIKTDAKAETTIKTKSEIKPETKPETKTETETVYTASTNPEEFVNNGFNRPDTATTESESSPFDQTYKFVNMPLPYAYNALEPFIDKLTMHLHHDKHLQKYIDELNAALAPYPRYHNWRLERLLQMAETLPAGLKTAVINNGGGVYNHFFYFESLTPRNDFKTVPPAVSALLTASFKSIAGFKAEFKKKALSVFGSGYAWLVLCGGGKAEITTTANQNTPLAKRQYPLLNIDVWEHSYYLKHYNLRDAYIDDWFDTVNWHKVGKRLSEIRALS